MKEEIRKKMKGRKQRQERKEVKYDRKKVIGSEKDDTGRRETRT
jgi:hypothetical protein